MVVYARLEPPKYQELHRHLLGTMVRVGKLVQAQPIKCVVQRLAELIGVGFSEVVETAKTAAVFHDLGKALHHYQKYAPKIKKEGKNSLTFSLHEIVSANFHSQTCHIHLNQTLKYPYAEPWLANLATQAILLHHQGLRTITIAKLLNSKVIEEMVNDQLTETIRNLQETIQEIRLKIDCEPARILLDILQENANNVITYNPSLIQQLYNLADPIQMQISRMITGCLMIADSLDAYEAVGEKASRYIWELLRFSKTLDVPLCEDD